LGLGAGASLFDQRFETRGVAPSRLSAAPFIAPGIGVQLDLSRGFYAALHVWAETHFLSTIDGAAQRARLGVAFAARSGLAVGKYF
jgi:hypothetical protein